ncbi:MAG: dethiobiotin synthase [Bacteroidetes bacterium HGW-Bacteroidetes-6]|nr:MAG: dethiobiotin synthase [Bacteroidetes bacterium HGW-Bacteroidetes-6]
MFNGLAGKNQTFFVAGIGTGVGKTLASTILCRALNADYWKPVQSGSNEGTDSNEVRKLTGGQTHIFPETYLLREPLSPHAAAEKENTIIDPAKLVIPETNNNLIIEGAGGLMVPITSDGFTFGDLVQHWQIPAIIVSRHYLGSINHTLLSIDYCRNHQIPVAGLVFNGNDPLGNEKIICRISQLPALLRIPEMPNITIEMVDLLAKSFNAL